MLEAVKYNLTYMKGQSGGKTFHSEKKESREDSRTTKACQTHGRLYRF